MLNKLSINGLRLKYDIQKFWSLWLFLVFIVYFSPSLIINFVFLILIFLMIYKKKYNYFWIALWFTLLNSPGNFFAGGQLDDIRQLPSISYGPYGFDIEKFLPVFFLAKVIYHKKRENALFVFRKDMFFLLIIFLIYLIISPFFGMDIGNLLNTIFILFYLTLFYTIPVLLSHESIINLDRLLFTVVIVAFASQLFSFITGNYWIDFFKSTGDSNRYSEGLVSRAIFSPYIILYTFHKSFFYLYQKQKIFTSKYLSIIITISLLSIFLSATRGWIIGAFFSLFLMFIFLNNTVNLRKLLGLIIFGTIIVSISILSIPKVNKQFEQAYDRFSTITKLKGGDVTMDGSLYRVTNRAPIMLEPFYKSPFIGYGFSETYWEKKDQHIGHLMLLLNLGVIGYLIIMFYFIKWFFKILRLSNKNKLIKIYFGNSPKVIAFGLLFILIIHSTSHYFIGFDIEIAPLFSFVLFISTFNGIVSHVKKKSLI
tara:strand:+ start:430 stop:1875 length:1446 start_codon:yes stop_codon:yes gene_type:complete